MKKKLQSVLVTTAHRGVFFGYMDTAKAGKTITLTDARNCIYWSQDMKGFLGLASSGPSQNCKVGPKVVSLFLTDVTSIAPVSDEAAQKWEGMPWSV